MTDVPTIAIVEDDGDIRGQLAGYLEGEGFRVVGLDGGAGLDRHLAAGPAPDLIVLDWMLPGEDGLSIRRRLREAGGPPVVMLTPPRTRTSTGCSAWRWVPTTSSRSRSTRACCSPASGRSCGGRRGMALP